ncbi:MAG: hypothetical protein PHW88_01540, partial [Bacteroidales bacterium]|nr:hypothetical protein [Bacteroidales bacterium]NLF81901.1 hypothetical protein [Bacteroidales bacterium]
AKKLDPDNVIYIECNPDMNSRLSFYAEEYYRVDFSRENGKFVSLTYKQLTDEEIKELIFNGE